MPAADDRVPVRLARAHPVAPGDALLIEGSAPAPDGHAVTRFRLSARLAGHPPGCTCCVPRGPVARALGELFLARARGDVAWFGAVAVLATPAGEAAVRAALAEDQVCAGRFRLADG